MKKVKFYLSVSWRPFLYWIFAFALVGAILFYRLGTLVPGAASVEIDTLTTLETKSLGIRELVTQPLYLPYQLGIYLFEKLGFASLFIARSIGALIGVACVFSFYYLVSRWHTRRIALLTTALFASSSWFLHTARLAGTDTSFLLLLPLLACGAWLHDTRSSSRPIIIASIVSGFLLYVPGMIWFILAGLLWQRKRFLAALADMRHIEIMIVGLLAMILLAPAAYASSQNISILLRIIGIPEAGINPSDMLGRAIEIPRALFIKGPSDPIRWVGNMPLMDALTGVMLLIGTYAYYFRLRLDRTKILLLGVVLGAVLYIVGSASMALLLPLVYIIVAAGVTHLLQQWFAVFPRNPFARSVGTSLIALAVGVSVFYNLSHYFVAWAKAPETRAVFTQRR